MANTVSYSKVGQLILIPRFIIKLIGIKTAQNWHKDRQTNGTNQRVQKDRYIYGQLIFDKVVKANQQKNIFFLQKSCWNS